MRFGTVAAIAWNAQHATKKRSSWKKWTDFLSPMSSKPGEAKGLTHREVLQQAREMVQMTYPWKHSDVE
jgi:hypothetical protein